MVTSHRHLGFAHSNAEMLPDHAYEDGVHSQKGRSPSHVKSGDHGGLYFPASQLVHMVDASTVVYLPTPQAVHSAEPMESLYSCRTASHAVHVPPFAPVYPALHWHLIFSLLPLAEIEFEGHSVHVEDIEAPETVEYFPAEHSKHKA